MMSNEVSNSRQFRPCPVFDVRWVALKVMFTVGHKRTSAFSALMSAFAGKAVVTGPKTDIGSLRSAIGGKADVDFGSQDVHT